MIKHNFKIGDNVSVLDDVIKGEIIEIIATQITIKNQDGFQFKYQYHELVKIFDFNESYLINHKQFSKEKKFPVKIKKNKKRQEILEIDLHIHQITKSNKYLSNYDMLTRQINFAEQEIKKAIKNKTTKIVFIHGIGQGILKTKLHKLFKKYNVEINDANYKKYGKGATEIYIFLQKKKLNK